MTTKFQNLMIIYDRVVFRLNYQTQIPLESLIDHKYKHRAFSKSTTQENFFKNLDFNGI